MTQHWILGISAFYHDSAACLLRDGEIIAAAQEERFTRRKGDAAFPTNAVTYCLKAGGIAVKDLTHVGFYDKPLLKFERILETYLGVSPRGFPSFLRAGQDAFDLIFLDGDHGARTVFLEVPLALQRLNSGGMIVLHDFFPGNRPLWRGQHAIAGPWLAIERLRNNGARLQAIPLGALPWPTKAGSNVTSLAVLAKA